MSTINFKKILKDNVSFGLIALGVYNIILFVRYINSGRDISVIPAKINLVVADILVVVITTVITIIIDWIIRMLCKNKPTDSSGSEE